MPHASRIPTQVISEALSPVRGLCVGAAGCAVLVGAGVCFGLSLWSGFGVALAAEARALTGEEVGAALGKDGALYLTIGAQSPQAGPLSTPA